MNNVEKELSKLRKLCSKEEQKVRWDKFAFYMTPGEYVCNEIDIISTQVVAVVEAIAESQKKESTP